MSIRWCGALTPPQGPVTRAACPALPLQQRRAGAWGGPVTGDELQLNPQSAQFDEASDACRRQTDCCSSEATDAAVSGVV
jgi:hypothetical protein